MVPEVVTKQPPSISAASAALGHPCLLTDNTNSPDALPPVLLCRPDWGGASSQHCRHESAFTLTALV
jgi:hypothetical protein